MRIGFDEVEPVEPVGDPIEDLEILDVAEHDAAEMSEALDIEDTPLDPSDDATTPPQDPQTPFGRLDLPKPEYRDAARPKFRIALLGDFTGRASRGDLAIGDDLARRRPIKFDVDTIDDVIAGFATTLSLPIGADGAGVDVPLKSLDDLHPDELYDNLSVFEDLSVLRQRVAAGDAGALGELKSWGDRFGDTKLSRRARAKGTAVPADRRLSDFQALLAERPQQAAQSGTDTLIEQIVGPFVQAAPDPEQPAMLEAIDAALSETMRAVLHHPDFQAVESTWRALDLIARRITTGARMDVVLYDVSAEEWAADLAAQEDLSQSGLFRMLAEEPRLDEVQGPISAVFGLYTLEETPPHAELMARMAKIADWMNAPFVAAMSSATLDSPKKDRHPISAKVWDELRTLPEASYVGLAASRFLLRLPYGARTEPVDPFDFDEFSLRVGLKGMLWANPVVLAAILLAETVNQKGKEMKLGQVMSLGDMPFHYMTDQYGDQIALPCTDRLLSTRTMADVVSRGYMPLLSIKGRNEVRLGSFQGLGPGLLAGPWGQSAGSAQAGGTFVSLDGSIAPPPAPEPAHEDTDEADDDDNYGFGGDDDDFTASDDDSFDLGSDDDLDLGDTDSFDLGDDFDLSEDATGSGDDELDDLLAGFGDDDASEGDDEIDPELAALLEDL